MLLFLLILILVVCVLLILVVLAQNSKGGGLTAGVGSATQQLGALRSTSWIENATWVLGGTLFFLCLVAGVTLDQPAANSGIISPNVERAQSAGGGVNPLGIPDNVDVDQVEDNDLLEGAEDGPDNAELSIPEEPIENEQN
jgi:preprotein translocase subunit SecG